MDEIIRDLLHPTKDLFDIRLRVQRETFIIQIIIQNEQQMNNSHRPNSAGVCFRCRKPGHIKAHCPLLKKDYPVQQQKAF